MAFRSSTCFSTAGTSKLLTPRSTSDRMRFFRNEPLGSIRAIRRLVDRAAGTLIGRRSLVRSALTGAAAISLPSQDFAQVTPMTTPGAAPAQPQPSPAETWTEPGIWRPSEWPGRQLDLNITEIENLGAIVGFGNETAVLFSDGGGTLGPTNRMRGDEVLLVTLRSSLGRDFGTTPVGPCPRVDQAGAWSQSLSFV